MKRRTLLAAAVGSTVGLAGCGGGPTDPWSEPTAPDRPDVDAVADAWGFDEVVDLGGRGADPFAEDPLGPVLDDAAADGALLYLPPGRYRLEETWSFPSFSSFGIVADEATIVPRQGFNSQLLALGSAGDASRLFVRGIRFDFRADGTGGRPIDARVRDELVLEDVVVTGRQDVESEMIRVDVTSTDGVGRVERLRMTDGSVNDWAITGCYVGDSNRGDISFVDCRIEGFSDNGLYAGPPGGRVRVLGGYYANNDVASVRVNAAPGSLIRGVHVRCDEAPSGFENMRGIRLRGGRDVLVDNCLVELYDVTASDGAIVFHSDLESATVRNSHIHVDADGVNGILIKRPEGNRVFGGGGPFRIENVVVTGTATGTAAIRALDRTDCVFDELCVHQSGQNRGGIYTERVSGSVRDSYFAVTDQPYRFTNSQMETVNVTVEDVESGGSAAPLGSCTS